MAEGWPRPAARSGRAERRENHSFTQQTSSDHLLHGAGLGNKQTQPSGAETPARLCFHQV